MNLLRKIFGFLFGKYGPDCINCVYCGGPGEYPCNHCSGECFEDRRLM